MIAPAPRIHQDIDQYRETKTRGRGAQPVPLRPVSRQGKFNSDKKGGEAETGAQEASSMEGYPEDGKGERQDPLQGQIRQVLIEVEEPVRGPVDGGSGHVASGLWIAQQVGGRGEQYKRDHEGKGCLLQEGTEPVQPDSLPSFIIEQPDRTNREQQEQLGPGECGQG